MAPAAIRSYTRPMARVSYQSLIEDHLAIASLSHAILQESMAVDADLAEISYTLGKLSVLVVEHLAEEKGLILELARVQADNPWDSWEACKSDFIMLKSDWSTFLDTWNPDQIRQDFQGFKDSAVYVLSHLENRVRKESGLLYARALQQKLIPLVEDRYRF